MNLEQALYRRDREEYLLSLIHFYPEDLALHLSRQEEAEQEIDMEMRR